MKVSRKLKKPDTSSKLVLEEIIGLTTKNANGLASSFLNSKCVYMAGCVVVVYNVDSSSQSHLMVSHRMPKPLTCVAVSHDGRFVAAGESGHQPAVLVWDSATLAFVSELKGHQYGVLCIAFSPDGKHLVSVGFPHDGYICLWDWQTGLLVTKLKSSASCSAVASVCFSSDAKFIVTAGKKHLKFWTVGSFTRPRSNTGAGSLAMNGKPVNLGHQKGSSFVSVVSPIRIDGGLDGSKRAGGFFHFYALTDAGVLCLLNSGLSVQKSVDLKVEKGFALSASDKLIACACSNGIVRLYTTETLKFAGNLQYSEAKKCHEANDMMCHTKVTKQDLQLASTIPDAMACQFSTSEKLVVVYEDHSLYLWDIRDVHKATRCCVLVSHSACIWDIKNLSCENMHDPSLACVARGCSGGVSFATCSADGTIRLWDLALQPDSLEDDSTQLATDHHSLITEPVNATHLVSAGIFERDTVESGVSAQGFRSMAVSSDGKYLAAGDCQGNLHIYNLHTSDYICMQDAHYAEILSLSFTLPNKKDVISEEVFESHHFLASGGRDRMIHLYDVERNFDLIESIDDHSAAVTSVKLACNGCKILSCSADRSLVFRDVAVTDTGCKVLRRHHQMASHGTVYDMAIDPTMEVAVTVGQDKKINTFNIAAGKLIKSFKQDGDFGDPIKVTMDPSCSYLLCSYSNKSICVYDFLSGEMITQAMGHGEVITGVIFLPDCKHIISVGGDGCIFVWKVPAFLSSRMLQRMKENSGPLSAPSMVQPVALSQFTCHEEGDDQCKINPEDMYLLYQGMGPQETPAFKFSISRLPKWAKDKVISSEIVHRNPEFILSQQAEVNIFSPLVGNGGEYAPVHPKVQSPSKLDLGELDLGDSGQRLGSMSSSSSVTDNSQSSPVPQETISFAMDKRWLTIHTVCLDLLSSPEVWDLKDVKMPVFAPNLLQDPALEVSSNGEHEVSLGDPSVMNHFSVEPSFGHGDFVVDDGQCLTLSEHPRSHNSGSMWENNVQYGIHSMGSCREVVISEVSKELESKSTESEVQATMNVESQDSDLFNQHFGNLSTTPKIEGRKSSSRRSYSARFTVRRDNFRDCKRLFDTSIRYLGGETLKFGEEVGHHITLEDPSIPVQEEQQMIDSFRQDLESTQSLLSPSRLSQCESTKCCITEDSMNESTQSSLSLSCLSQCESTKCCITEDSMNTELIEVRNPKECVPETTEMQERIIACKEQLLCLDAAAENALQLFSKLGTLVSREEISTGPGAQLYTEAAEMLPSIAEKVHAIANLVQSSNIKSRGKTRVEDSSFEPLLGTFAESLSHRVVEILKKNLSTL